MPRKKRDEPRTGMEDFPMNEVFIDALSGPGFAYRAAQVADGALPVFVLVAVGDQAKIWAEIGEDAMGRVRVALANGQVDNGEAG